MKLTLYLILSLLLFPAALAKADSADKNAQFIQALKNGKLIVVQTLLKQGADPNTIAITSGNDTGFSALLWASFNGHIDVVKLLLDKSADVNTKSKNDYTAMKMAKKRRFTDIVQLLEKAGAKE